MIFFSCNALNTIPLKFASMSNQEFKVRPTLFYPYSILVNKCSGSCNNINDPSNIVNEVIRGNFKLLSFFFTRTFYTHKKHKKNKNIKQVTFFFLDVFYEHKKHIRHK